MTDGPTETKASDPLRMGESKNALLGIITFVLRLIVETGKGWSTGSNSAPATGKYLGCFFYSH